MNALPWLLEHGASFWRACLFLSLAAGLGVAWLRPRLAARRAARAARRQLGAPSLLESHVAGGRVTLAGRLEVPAEGRSVLRVGDAAVLLDGPIDVLAGSREMWPGRLGQVGPAASQTLAAGDRVLVSGVLAGEASDDAASYRAPAKRWTLHGPIVAAYAGAPRVRGPGAQVHAACALAGGLGFLAVFGVGGEIAAGVAAEDVARLRGGGAWWSITPITPAIEIAAATPFRRHEVLGAVLAALDARRDADPQALATRAGIRRKLVRDRAEVAGMWIDHGEVEDGARLAEAAGRYDLAARGWYAAGDFDRAAETWERASASDEGELRFGVGVLLLAKRLDRAAHAARRLADALRAHPADGERLRRWYAFRARTATCLADALDARRGVADAWQALHPPVESELSPGCAALRVDLFDGAERIRAIRTLPPLANNEWDVPLAWLHALATEADPGFTIDDLPLRPWWAHPPPAPALGDATRALLVPNEGVAALALPSLDEHLAETVDPAAGVDDRGRGVWARATASAALFALLSGDAPRAQALARRLQRDLPDRPQGTGGAFWPAVEVQRLVALVTDDATLEDGWTRLTTSAVRPLVAFRDGDAERIVTSLTEHPAPDPGEMSAWFLAAGHNGLGLVDWLRRPVAQPGTFLRFGAPLLRSGRREVARWVRWGYRPPAGFRPTDEVVHLATLTAAAQALGDNEAAASLGERTRRFREAILRRETALPLAVLERL